MSTLNLEYILISYNLILLDFELYLIRCLHTELLILLFAFQGAWKYVVVLFVAAPALDKKYTDEPKITLKSNLSLRQL